MLTGMIASGVLALCTAVRWYLDRVSRRDREYAGGRVTLTALWNEGAAFGLPLPKRVLPVLSGLGLGFLWLRRKECPVGTGLILGGGLSNLSERLKAGRVYDYIRFPKIPGKPGRYVFNLADFAIFLGGLLWLFKKERK